MSRRRKKRDLKAFDTMRIGIYSWTPEYEKSMFDDRDYTPNNISHVEFEIKHILIHEYRDKTDNSHIYNEDIIITHPVSYDLKDWFLYIAAMKHKKDDNFDVCIYNMADKTLGQFAYNISKNDLTRAILSRCYKD